MKFIHTAFLLLSAATFLHSQSLQVAPVQGNPVLRSFAAQEAVKNAAFVQQLTGHNPAEFSGDSRANDCPPDLEGNFVTSGESLEIKLDTTGLMLGDEDATITIENAGSLHFGSAQLDTIEPILVYAASPGLTGYLTDTVQLKLSQPGHDTIFQVEIFVRRAGRVLVTLPQTVDPESITGFCLGSELDFGKPKACSRSFDCPDDYDGAGFPIYHLSSYDYPDTCLVYYASRFPGVDTVCIRICDEWGVCDVFKVPYIIPGDTISIASQPFFDDFSSYDGPYPSSDFWLDKNVYRNYTLAKDPPSVGFVTFDGLSYRGDVYDIVTGVGDRLTSKAIDLSSFNPSSDVFLRFFLAPKGYGLEPEALDNMVLEFRNADREWVTVGTYQGTGNVPLDSFPLFLFYAIKVDDAQFFHEVFQFRFSANTSPGGSVDLWHLDYIRLSKSEGSNDNFSDIAFTQLPSTILRNNTAMPWRHFKGHVADEVRDDLTAHFYNHFDGIRAIAESNVTFKETTTGMNIGSGFTVVESGTDNNMEEKVHIVRNRTIPAGNFTGIKAGLEGIPIDDLRILESKFAFVATVQLPGFASNDTVVLENTFSNYFAHDDGTAEWQVFIEHGNGNQQFATQFHANVPDTLKAVRIMFPHVNGDVQALQFNLKIWAGSLENDPVLVRPLLNPFYPNNVFDTLQGFTTYVLEDFDGNLTPVALDTGDFFVGIEQASAATFGIPVGFDLQNQCDCNWLNLEGQDTTWHKFPASLQGALMVRPVFGAATNTNSGTVEVAEAASPVLIYPNPTTGLVNFSVKDGNYQDYRVAIFNNLGQLVTKGQMARSLDLGSLAAGVYFVRMLNEKTGELFSERIFLSKN